MQVLLEGFHVKNWKIRVNFEISPFTLDEKGRKLYSQVIFRLASPRGFSALIGLIVCIFKN